MFSEEHVTEFWISFGGGAEIIRLLNQKNTYTYISGL